MTVLRTALVGGILAVLVAACSGGGSAASASVPPDADLVVESVDMAFDTDTITLASGQTTTVFYRNLDGAPHNIAIYTDESASEPLFVGETITDDAVTYEVPALEPGTYFFRCDVHPEMNGTVVVEEG